MSTLEDLKQGFQRLARMVQSQDTTTLPALRKSNRELDKSLQQFREEFTSSTKSLFEGQVTILTVEFESLCRLANANGMHLQSVMDRVVINNQRVTKLYFRNCQLMDLSALADMRALTDLELSGCQLTNIGALAGLKHLETLFLHGTSAASRGSIGLKNALCSIQ